MVELDIQKTMGVAIAGERGLEYRGHRRRLREKYAAEGAAALADYELLELLLSFSIPHRDTKPYAKKLLAVFQNVRHILEADSAALQTLGELPPQSALHFKALGDLFRLAHQEEFKRGRTITSPEDVASFLKEQIGSRPREVFTSIFLDHRNHLLAFETLQEGTVDHTAVYPREILKRALELHATGLILSHNHPAGSLEPSEGDKQLTRQILTAARAMGITVHDHLILTTEGHFSFRQAGLLI
ncbi:MAG TPA: DNA repair protein RadC [bacterium]|jgi:DNA repair protein RadC|nr:DNA repair protein RadC [bacterium]